MTCRSVLVLTLAMALLGVACKKEGGGGSAATSKYPGTDEGARQLLSEIRTSSDARGLTLALKATSADYRAVFVDAEVAKAEAGYEKLWSDPKAVIGASPENTELLLAKATTEELQQWTAEVDAGFPGGYKRIAAKLKPGLTVYRWKYVKPGEKSGMAFDGLVHVNNRWVWFPKPWRVIGGTDGD
jgi:hypothetical protein